MSHPININEAVSKDWFTANRDYLLAFIDYARYLLKTSYPGHESERSDEQSDQYRAELEQARLAIPGQTAIDYLASTYGLTEFEKYLLLLCAAPDLDSGFLYAVEPDRPVTLNFSLALAVLPNGEWSAITALGALRRNGLLIVEENASNVTSARLRLPESILHFIVGEPSEDTGLQSMCGPGLGASGVLNAENETLVDQMVDIWRFRKVEAPAIYTLTGEHADIKMDVALALAKKTGMTLKVVPAFMVPSDINELQKWVIAWNREILLNEYLMLVECEEDSGESQQRDRLIDHFMDKIDWPVLCSYTGKRRFCKKEQYEFDVKMPTMTEQKQFWLTCLNGSELSDKIGDSLNEVCSHFDLSFRDIRSYAAAFHSMKENKSIWSTCRRFSKERMNKLAEKIEPGSGATNLVLPPREKSMLEDIVNHVKLRSTVYEDWGIRQSCGRGRGITALFVGSSGTGKTTAAEYLAQRLDLDLYRIDLSNIVSKYIGETEKNLQQIFNAAERSGAILLFDEADALFGKRTQVKDSHDKHANNEVSYLLQRMESFRGLAILTSNLKDSFDPAFMRRLRFIVQFPFPSAKEREAIWRAMLPNDAPSEGVNFAKLAQLSVAGGSIRNITLHACFSAAAENQSIQMKHYLAASRHEYEKMEKSLAAIEVAGWV